MELVGKKAQAIKDLDKSLKHMGAIEVAKAGERAKLGKIMEKVSDMLGAISVIDRLLKEKDF